MASHYNSRTKLKCPHADCRYTGLLFDLKRHVMQPTNPKVRFCEFIDPENPIADDEWQNISFALKNGHPR